MKKILMLLILVLSILFIVLVALNVYSYILYAGVNGVVGNLTMFEQNIIVIVLLIDYFIAPFVFFPTIIWMLHKFF